MLLVLLSIRPLADHALMKTNYVLIDYENVQPEAISVLNAEHFMVIIFVGANQSKVSYEIAAALQAMGDRAKYIKISGHGSNALDFHIAYHLGQLATNDPDGYFHIISKDKGFDPLIQYLKANKVFACRSADVTQIPIVKASNAKSPAEKLDVVVSYLQRRGPQKPRAIKTLSGSIKALFLSPLADTEVAALISELEKRQMLTVNGTKVSYSLPA